MRCDCRQMPMNFLKHCRSADKHVVIPEAQYPKPSRSQALTASCIVGDLLQVLPTIQFDHKLCVDADEVDDVAAHRVLAAEFPSAQLPPAEEAPEVKFGVRGLLAQCAGPFAQKIHEGARCG